MRDPARAIQACHHVFIAHALAVKAFREMGVAGEIGFVNVLQPHAALTDSEADKQATEMADAIHTHWLYDPVLKAAILRSCCRKLRRCGAFRPLNRVTMRCCVTTAVILSA